MEHTWLLHNLIVALGLLEECSAFPIHLGAGGLWTAGAASPLPPIALGAATLLAAAALLLGCVCCRQQKGFQDKTCMQDGSCKQNGTARQEKIDKHSVIVKQDSQDSIVRKDNACNGVLVAKEFTDSVVSSQNNLAPVPSSSPSIGLSNQASELTLFPPLGTTLAQPGDRSSIVHFEPLPDIHVVAAAAAARRKPAAFSNSLHHGLSVHDWFEEPIDNFPRHQLQYLRELGRGWFGRVVEGNAKEIISGHSTSKVVVKILHEDATPTDQSYFLHEAKAYRCLKHPNVLSLVGKCLETHPFLLLLEDCPSGTLKTFLTENRATAEKLSQQGVLLEMACGVAAGLLHMVENGFVHTDLAARNCLVSSDLTVKVGDYGTGIETFKDEYYCVGDLAIPIRWVSPETLHCTDTTIETKEVTASANVWSLSIVLWEICELGKLPYFKLSDEEVIVQVLGNRSICLPFPSHENQPHVHNLYHLMKICWVEAEKRPPLERVVAMLQHLLQHKNSPAHTSANNNNNSTTSLDDFERRWELSKPNTVPKIDNQLGTSSMKSSPVKSVHLQRCASMEENVAPPVTQLLLNVNVTSDKANANPCADSPQLSLSSSLGGEIFSPTSLLVNQKSPSLQNLRGSVDELNVVEVKEVIQDSKTIWQAPETVTEEPDFDSWLKGMDTTTEEDVRFVRNISEAIRDLDEVLAQEKTSSSSQSSSAQPSPSQVTSRDVKPESHVSMSQDQKFTLDFRLGQETAPSLLNRSIGLLHSSGHDSLSLSQHRLESSGSDTEDETWRIRIERGEFSEKVKEKSKSVADLMVLTHIDYSDGSDSDTTLDSDPRTSAFKINSVGRRSFHRKPLQSSLSVAYGSEGNIHQAVLGEEFQETIKRLQESLRDGSKLEAIQDASLSYVSTSSNEAPEPLSRSKSHCDQSHFLAKLASEKKMIKNDNNGTALSVCQSTEFNQNFNVFGKDCSQPSQVKETSISNCEFSNEMLDSSQIIQMNSNNVCTYEETNQKTPFSDDNNIQMAAGKPVKSSTPVPEVHMLTFTSADGSVELDSSLLHSQTLSFIDSEKNFSTSAISSSMESRPLSPTPGEIELKSVDSSCVILGPFEDSTLDYFKGLKTSFPAVKSLDYDASHDIDLDENSIETWDKFLDRAMQPVNCDYPSFSEVSFTKTETESPTTDVKTPCDSSDILGSSFESSGSEKTVVTTKPSPVQDSEENGKKSLLSDVTVPHENGMSTNAVNELQIGTTEVLELCLNSSTSTSKAQTNSNSSLIVPSVKVIEATPLSSGRNSPNVPKSISVPVESPDNISYKSCIEDDVNQSQSKRSETFPEASLDPIERCSNNVTVGFMIPQFEKAELSAPKFDPDLPCCDGFVHELASDCFINSNLDQDILIEDFKPVIQLFSKAFDPKEVGRNGDMIEDEDEFGLGVAKNLTPDDERSSDSGFRDKGSLSESCEDACDEKYNLEDIEAELEEAFSKGVFARHDSPTSNKGLESDCDIIDETFSVTLIDVEKQREQREAADLDRSEDPCRRLDGLLRGDQIHNPLCVDVESCNDFFGTSPALSPIPQSSGWYLHPPQSQEDTSTEPISGNDSSYFSFNLDEEFVNAIRNELREKLPCAQAQREDKQPQLSDEEEHSDEELDSDDSPSRERTNIVIHYKTYPAPLSPILEEGESICSESSSPLGGYNTSSSSEQLSPVFAVDPCSSNQGDGSVCQIDDDVQHIESEGPAEVDGDLSDDCGDCVLFDELSEHDVYPADAKLLCSSFEINNLCLNADGDEDDDDDVLVVNTETNEATLLESPKPVSKFTFVASNDECDDSSNDDFVPDFLSVAGSYQLPESKFNNIDLMRKDFFQDRRSLTLSSLQQSSAELESDGENDNAMTPDSITCDKSFSERTEEDSAVGLALSEVMTPDSLTGETQWTSAQMCDSGFGTISSRTPCNIPSSESFERVSPELDATGSLLDSQHSPATQEPFIQSVPLPSVTHHGESELIDLCEVTQLTEDSESSVSASSTSVIAAPNKHFSSIQCINKERPRDPFNDSVSRTTDNTEVKITTVTQDMKHDVHSFILEEKKSSSDGFPVCLGYAPHSLKEMARNALENNTNLKGQTLAFSSDLLNTDEIITKKVWKPHYEENKTSKTLVSVENGRYFGVEGKIQGSSPLLESEEPLQTLAFSDPEVMERSNFPGPGHIVVSSVITPLTPNDETVIPGTLAFNESPESPCETLSPVFKESDAVEAESHLMSTSFMSADDLYDDQDQYTPDWESGSDGCESETASSSSGEFIWKDGERESSVKAVEAAPDSTLRNTHKDQGYHQTLPEFPMSSILEEEEDNCGSRSSSCSSDSEDDADFVPSAWDSQATPSRSALRSPDKKVELKKNVSFKRQRYHCVYEYPRELSDSDGSEFADSPSRRRTWDLESHTLNQHDWELADNEGMAETPCLEELGDEKFSSAGAAASQRLFHFYKSNSPEYGFGSTMLSEDGEFFISSSAQPFHTLGEAGCSGSSEFFPGRDLSASSVDDSDVVDGIMDSSSLGIVQPPTTEKEEWHPSDEFSDSDSSDTNMITASEGSFSQQKSVDSNSSSTPMVTANGSSKSSDESSVYHSLPTNQELQVDSGSDSPLSELSPPSPLSPTSPSHGLGELRHTRDRLKLDLPAPNAAFVLVAPCKRRSVEQVKGEASLLDGEEILENTGYKSSNACVVGESIPLSSNVH